MGFCMCVIKKTGDDLLSRCYAVPSALQGLTTLFGMGRGDHLGYSRRKLSCLQMHEHVTGFKAPGKHINFPADAGYPLIIKKVKSIGLLVLLGSTHYCAYTCSLSTWSSSRSLMGKSHLEASFALRCFQRLAQPNIATQRCHWRDNWCTRGLFVSVLSY